MSELAFEMGRKQGRKDVYDAMPDQIDIFRAIRKSGVRKHGDIARVIAEIYASPKEPKA
jgi:hypothetical protein